MTSPEHKSEIYEGQEGEKKLQWQRDSRRLFKDQIEVENNKLKTPFLFHSDLYQVFFEIILLQLEVCGFKLYSTLTTVYVCKKKTSLDQEFIS